MLAASVSVAAPPAAGGGAAQGAAAAGGPAAKAAASSPADVASPAAVEKLNKEKAQLAAELAKKDQQIAALAKLLKDNGIEVPAELASADAADAPAAATARPARASAKSAATNDRSEADAPPAAAPADKGPWPVTIVSNEEPSQDELKEQLAEAIGKLKFADQNYAEAKQRHDRMAGEREYQYNRRGDYYKPKYTNAQLGEPRREMAKAEAEKRRAQQTVARLERQIADAGKSHMVVGQLEDGTTVEITAASAAQVQLARGLQVGERYRVAGNGRMDNGTLRVRMSSASLMADPARPAGAVPARAAAPRRRSPAAATDVAEVAEEGDPHAATEAGDPAADAAPAPSARTTPARPARPAAPGAGRQQPPRNAPF